MGGRMNEYMNEWMNEWNKNKASQINKGPELVTKSYAEQRHHQSISNSRKALWEGEFAGKIEEKESWRWIFLELRA